MADRYWVGGTDTWDATAGTKWAATSGGAGGETVPTASDDVFFDANSGAVTVTIGTSRVAKSINCTGFTGTLGNSSGAITVSGSVTLVAGMTYNHTGTMTFNGTGTLTTAGKTFSGVNVDGSGITLTLGDSLNVGTRGVFVSAGTFDTASYSVSAGFLSTATTSTRAIILGSSTVTLLNGGLVFNTFQAGLTLDAGTSELVLTQSNNSIAVVGTQTSPIPWYNVSFTATTSGDRGLFGSFSFNDLSVTAPSSAGFATLNFRAAQTINGTFSTTGTAGNRRVWFRSDTYGIAHTLTINGSTSLTDADFRDLYVVGTAAPISGTRIGNLRGCDGITFDTAKSVYRIGTGNWSDNQWAATSGGAVSTDNFPLAQDTAVFDESTTGGTHTMNSAVPYTGTVDMSARTSALTLSLSSSQSIHGDWTFGSGITISGAQNLSFEGRNTQVITSAGKTFSGGIGPNSYGGTVELADALNIGANNLTVTNGTFDTKGYNVTAGALSSNNSNVREIKLGASTVTLSGTTGIDFGTPTNLTFDAGTSSIVCTASFPTFAGNGQTFYDVSLTNTGAGTTTLSPSNAANVNTFNSLSITAPSSAGLRQVALNGDQIITGTLTAAGASAVRRIMLRSSVIGTTRTMTVGTLSADDCDFRDITIAGTAAGGSPTRAGDCGGNSGVTFPAAKTVYWNLAGTQNWSADAWATTSGGSPATNNFPLAQDTAVFDDTGSAGTVTIQAFNVGTFDASARTSAVTFTMTDFDVYGDWKHGAGITFSAQNAQVRFSTNGGTQTITSNGVSLGTNQLVPNTVNNGKVILADAFVSSARLQHRSGEFDASTFNVTVGSYDAAFSSSRTLRMGSGLWTLTSTSTIWSVTSASAFTFYKGTADILLSDTSTAARTFTGGGLSYNKLTIGGATGTSTLTINDNNQFTELASTKTVAHTIALGSTTQTFGKWSVTGTSGNVVTLTGTGTSHQLVGSCTSGIDYLAIGSIRFAATSPAEFYAGANSTATGSPAAPTYLTDKPADSTRYWVGGTGNWSDTNRWSTGSGGAGGASVPRSHDDVVFDSSSNATAYTATVDAVTGGARCKALTIAGPASGNVTLAGSTALFIHDDITLPATGLTRTYTGTITLSGSTSGKTITTNGVALSSAIVISGQNSEWSLGSALNTAVGVNVFIGSLDTANYNITAAQLTLGVDISTNTAKTPSTLIVGSSIVTLSNSNPFNVGFRFDASFSSGTSQFNITSTVPSFAGSGHTFYNVSFTSTAITTATINGANTFNNLTVAGRASAGVSAVSISADQTINGTLTLSAGTNATCRTFVRPITIGTTRTLTCAAFSGTDADFRDITIAGAAAPVSGTRLGDCKGNSGITFVAGANKYWNFLSSTNWSATAWATSSGGAVSNDNFPLAQDTCIFEATGLNSGASVTINASYNIGSIDMSARTTNTMTLTCSESPFIHGNWINGTGTNFSGSGLLTFSGRGSQTITSAGKTFTQRLRVTSPNGSVTLQDALQASINTSNAVELEVGTLDANNYNVTISGASGTFGSSNSSTRTLAMGSGTWSVAGSGTAWDTSTSTNLTVTGTGTISLTSASSKTFAGGGANYSGITLNQGGAGNLTVSGNNQLANITKTTSAATTMNFGTTTQRLGNFTASGSSGNVLTIQGTSATSPCTLIHTGTGDIDKIDYVTITGVRAYPL